VRWRSGRCKRAAACKFLHFDSALSEEENSRISALAPARVDICADYKRGACHRGATCKFSHNDGNVALAVPAAMMPGQYMPFQYPTFAGYPTSTQTPDVCGDFRNGKCARGTSCRYLHADPSGGNPQAVDVCGDWRNGCCLRGKFCKYRHSELQLLPASALFSQPMMMPAPTAPMMVAAPVQKIQDVCGEWRRGTCQRGNACKYLHERPVCADWVRGKCSRGSDCKYRHKQTSEVCADWKRGVCTRGDECKYLHEKSIEQPMELCGDWRRGTCARGDQCRFRHIDEKPSCADWQRGVCTRESDCKYRHDDAFPQVVAEVSETVAPSSMEG